MFFQAPFEESSDMFCGLSFVHGSVHLPRMNPNPTTQVCDDADEIQCGRPTSAGSEI